MSMGTAAAQNDSRLAVLEVQMKALTEQVTKLLVKFEDNGKLGILTRMTNAENRIEDIECQHEEEKEAITKAEDRRKKNQDSLIIGIVMLILSNIGVIVALITQITKP